MSVSLERLARRQTLFREVNERIEELGLGVGDGRVEFLSECGRDGCEAWIRLTPEEYDRLRTQDDRFALALHHETEGLEGIVERTDRFLVVDKLDQFEPLVADDPRGASSK